MNTEPNPIMLSIPKAPRAARAVEDAQVTPPPVNDGDKWNATITIEGATSAQIASRLRAMANDIEGGALETYTAYVDGYKAKLVCTPHIVYH